MTDPKVKKATALKYEGAASAPVVVASGQGEIAERIVKLAQEAGLHISSDPVLAELLAKVPVGDEIPEELYQAVAEILTYVYRLNNGQIEEKKDPATGQKPEVDPLHKKGPE